MDHANWIARRAANRDPAVGIVARSALRVVPTAAGLRSPSRDCFGPVFRASLRPIAAHRGHRHWPSPSPARVRPRSLVPFKLKLEAASSGQRLRPLSGHCTSGHCRTSSRKEFPGYTRVAKCVRGELEQLNPSSKQMPFTSMISVMRKAYSMSLRSMRWSLSGTRSLGAGRQSSALRVQYGPVTSLRLGE
jgi:hypothetical protein